MPPPDQLRKQVTGCMLMLLAPLVWLLGMSVLPGLWQNPHDIARWLPAVPCMIVALGAYLIGRRLIASGKPTATRFARPVPRSSDDR